MSGNQTFRSVDDDEGPSRPLVPRRGKKTGNKALQLSDDVKQYPEGETVRVAPTFNDSTQEDRDSGFLVDTGSFSDTSGSKRGKMKGDVDDGTTVETTSLDTSPAIDAQQSIDVVTAAFEQQVSEREISQTPGANALTGPNVLTTSFVSQSETSSAVTPSPGQLHSSPSQATGPSDLITADTAIVATIVDPRKGIPCGIIIRDRRVKCGLLLAVVIIAGLLAAVIILSLDRSKTTTVVISPPSSTPVSIAPSKSPVRRTIAPSTLSQRFKEVISQAMPNGSLLLLNGTSPQSAAFDWMLKDPKLPSYTDDKLLQRYALTTFAFSVEVAPSERSAATDPAFGASVINYKDECNWTTAIQCNSAGFVSILDFNEDNLQGFLPLELALLTLLEDIHLFSNDLSGSIPAVFSGLLQLKYLALGWNSFTGTLPTELGRLTRLQVFDVQANLLTGTIPTEYGGMSALESFVLIGNSFAGTLPTEMLSLRTVSELVLRGNQINGTIPTEIGLLERGYQVDLAANSFIGTIPSEIKNIIGLTILELSDNQLTGAIPRLPPAIETIKLDGNQLAGRIPNFSYLTALSDIQLSNNLLNGTIPTELGLLELGGSLVLANNNFTGTIPTELGRLRQLTGYFQLQGNDFTGTIPTQLGLLNNLGSNFDLSDTKIRGTIPSELGNLVSLQHMYLQKNPFLGGTLPNEFGKLGALVDLMVYETALNGTVPEAVCNLTTMNLTDLYLDCAITCACCQKCD